MELTLPASDLKDLVVRLWQHLSPRRQRQFVLLSGFMVVGAFAEVISLGAVLPFIGILVAPDRIFNHPAAAHFVQAWGITSASQLVWPLTVAFALAALLAGAVRTLLLWGSTRLSYATGAELSMDVYRRTLYQPYQTHVARNSSVVISGITTKVNDAVNVLYLLLTFISSTLSGVAIVVALIAIDPFVAAVATVSFGASYGLTRLIFRRRLHRNSECIAYEQTQLVKAIQEGLGGIRDVLLDGAQSTYCDIYRRADQPLRRAQGSNIFIAQGPRFIVETFGMLLIAALAFGLSHRAGGMAAALPVLGALALGAQRLLPILQIGYSSWAGLVSNRGSLADVIKLLDQPLPADPFLPTPAPLPFRTAARFKAVRFRYSADGPWVLDDLSLTIHKGSRVGLVGTTGSGKSTALDLLMGLLTPTEGEVLVDGQPVTGNSVRAWQRTIAHVPQSIFLTDTTLAENIAFGVPRESIDRERVKRAASQAQIADFIEGCTGGYDTVVGERGVRLSGGQRQRIGIARALYKQASELVFDEATSALDNATEQSVMEAIGGLDRELTIVLIAHRLTTVRRCDIIVELEHGRVVAQGTYDQLLQSSPSFRGMARAVV
jgi:ABC-type multidrug transport system fused ATPase/permease subunit